MQLTPYVEARETHTGTVVLVGNRAYKTKRPVVTGFLDFSTTARRAHALRRELELNSRLAPQAYLGLAQLTGPADGETEPVLVMRRYPDTARLSTRIREGADGLDADVDAVARALADFHASARRGRDVDVEARVSAFTARWDANLAELAPFAGEVVSAETVRRIDELAHQYVSGRAVLFADRITSRRIVDGHADLLADDIFCLGGHPVLLDCLDFDDRLRYVDGADDAAFLAMDLEYLGRRDLADRFFDEYCRRAGDSVPRSLRDFYIGYRAVVRAKVDCVRHAQGHPEAGADAARHLDLALDHLRAAVPQLVLVGGGPGTGKTTLARSLAEQMGAQVISTDDVRDELRRDGVISGDPGAFEAGLYSPQNVAAVYRVVLRRAHSLLAGGQSVILDGTWRDAAQRARARALAETAHVALREMACTASLGEAQTRIARRTGSTSDATAEIAAELDAPHAGGDPWPGAHRINTERPLADSVAEAQELCCVTI